MIWMSHELKKPSSHDHDEVHNYHRFSEEKESSEATYTETDSDYSQEEEYDDQAEVNPMINEATRFEDEEDQDEGTTPERVGLPTIRVNLQ